MLSNIIYSESLDDDQTLVYYCQNDKILIRQMQKSQLFSDFKGGTKSISFTYQSFCDLVDHFVHQELTTDWCENLLKASYIDEFIKISSNIIGAAVIHKDQLKNIWENVVEFAAKKGLTYAFATN